jgi:pimeloyl-ACP methyl ester carboxylesterase
MGGWIALNAAVHAPGRVDGLALLGPVGIKSPLKVLYRLFRFMLFPTESGKRSMVAWTLGDDPEVRAEFEQYMMTALDCRGKLPMPRTLSDDDLRSVTVPVLLLLGEDDNPVPDPEGLRAKAERLIAGIEVGILADTGHIMNVEEPGSVNRRILEFLGETAPAPAQVPGG